MEIERRSRLLIRHDWEVAISNNESVWTSYKKGGGGPSVAGKLKKGVNVKLEQGDQCSEESAPFHATLLDKDRLELSYSGSGSGEGLRTVLQCPSHQFRDIHVTDRSMNSLDVSGSKPLGVSSSCDGDFIVWDSATGQIKHHLKGHAAEVNRCKFFPSGIVIMSASLDMRLKVWCAEEGYCAATLTGHTRGVTDFSFIDRGRHVVSSSRDASLRLWDVSQSQSISSFLCPDAQPINCCLVQPVWDVTCSTTTTASVPAEEGGGVGGVGEEGGGVGEGGGGVGEGGGGVGEGKVVFAGTDAGELIGWTVLQAHQIFRHSSHSAINSFSFISGHSCIYGTDDSTLHLLDLRNTTEAVKVVKEDRGAILDVKALSGGSVVVATADGSCYSINPTDLALTSEFTGSDLDPVREVAADLHHVFTACRDGVVRKYRRI